MTYNGGARGGTQIPLLTPIVTAGETHGIFRNKKPLTKSTLVIYHKKKKGHYESKEKKKETTRAEHLHKNLHRGNYTLKGLSELFTVRCLAGVCRSFSRRWPIAGLTSSGRGQSFVRPVPSSGRVEYFVRPSSRRPSQSAIPDFIGRPRADILFSLPTISSYENR